MGGRVTAGISGYGEYEGQIKTGRLRAIGVSSPNRLPGVNVPTFKEQGIDLVLTNWRSVVARARHHARADASRSTSSWSGP